MEITIMPDMGRELESILSNFNNEKDMDKCIIFISICGNKEISIENIKFIKTFINYAKKNSIDIADALNYGFVNACIHGNNKIIEVLLNEKQINPRCYNDFGFKYAIMENNWKIVKLLIGCVDNNFLVDMLKHVCKDGEDKEKIAKLILDEAKNNEELQDLIRKSDIKNHKNGPNVKKLLNKNTYNFIK
jgi:hypothetical protein